MTGPNALSTKLEDKIQETMDQQKNAFNATWIWLKGEILDIKGMIDAINGRDKTIEAQHKAEENRRTKQSELDSMTMGKTTLKSFFKSKSTIEKDINKYQERIDQLNQEIEDFNGLVNFMTIYQGQLAIEKFKQLKVQQYFKMLNHFSVREISNAHISAMLYHTILELNEI